MTITEKLAEELCLKRQHVENVIQLIDDGNTIPFIARYRKEATGSMDDQVLRILSERLQYLRNLEKRREEVINNIDVQGKLNEELKEVILYAETLTELEDLYRPYRPKRRTRATIAREKGLEPLAKKMLEQEIVKGDALLIASEFLSPEREVHTAAEAIGGAMDIIAEDLSDDAALRKKIRAFVYRSGLLTASAAKEEDSVYRLYYQFSEPINRIVPHRVLAIDRGERELFLKVKIESDKEKLAKLISLHIPVKDSIFRTYLTAVCADSLERLIYPSIEREIRNSLSEKAADSAIKVFAVNLKNLLLQAPVKNKVVLGLDPAYRTGCKIAVVDETGKVLDTAVIYPTQPQNRVEEARKKITELILRYGVQVISIGNGTASKEAEIFVADTIKNLDVCVRYMVVNEAGASVYSASKLGAEEFPQYDVSLRSAVSIARRLQDPLAELVKIDPKAIGIGQYQHDMKEANLDGALDAVVEDCVNSVGVDLNTASVSLLSYVAGLSKTAAQNIIRYREEKGYFEERTELKKIKKIGPKAFQQCAGFLRIPESDEFLDHTGVHPESYQAVKKLFSICGILGREQSKACKNLHERIVEMGYEKAAEECGIGEPTLRDIVKELEKPGRDPRDELPPPLLRTDILDMKDLKQGMILSGTVRNVTDFGAFVDIAVHQDGLVHLSQLCDRYIRHPSEVVKVGDIVKVQVLEVDVARKRIALTMKLS